MGKVRAVVIVSDIHCGSTVGILAPGFENFEGNAVKQNAAQEWLWDQWLDVWNEWVPSVMGDDPWHLIVNGDCVDGIHHRSVSNDPPRPVASLGGFFRAPTSHPQIPSPDQTLPDQLERLPHPRNNP